MRACLCVCALQNNTDLYSSIHVGNLQSKLTTTLFKTSGVGLNASHEDTESHITAKSLAAAGIASSSLSIICTIFEVCSILHAMQ